MADPHIKSHLDSWDYITVIIYRLGFVFATFMLICFAFDEKTAEIGLLISATMLASSLHLYMKSFRFIFQFAMWIGLFCYIFGLPQLALGAAFLTIGGLCFKEYFCFRVFGLNLQPILLAILWFSITFNINGLLSNILIGICSLLLALLSIQKWRMPLHFDIGDKTKYQI